MGPTILETGFGVNLARDPQAFDHHVAVAFRAEVVHLDFRIGQSVGSGDAPQSPALGVALPERGRETRGSGQRQARFVDAEWHGKQLKIGAVAIRVFGAHRAADLSAADGQRPALVQQPLQPHARQPDWAAHLGVERVAAVGECDDGAQMQMVLLVLAHLRCAVDDLDPL